MLRALKTRDMADLLALVMRHARRSRPRRATGTWQKPVTQTQLATTLGTQQSRLSDILSRTRTVTSFEQFEKIADALQMPDRARVVLGLAPRSYTLRSERTNGAPRTGMHAGPREQPTRGDVEPSKEVTVMAAAESESARFIQRAENSNVGPNTIDQLYADVRRIVDQYPSRPVPPSFVEALKVRSRVFTLLEGRQRPDHTRDLYLIAAALSGVLSNALFDLGHLSQAETHARAAFVAADQAGHNGMRAWIRGTQALIAYWDGRPQTAATAAADGWSYVPESGTARVRAACIEARAYARIGDSHRAEDALGRAEKARAMITSPDDIGGMMEFPRAKQLFYNSSARLLLDGGRLNLLQAERLATEATDLYTRDPVGRRRVGEISLARLDLAQVHLLQNDLEAAAHHISDVLDIGTVRRTEAVSRRLFELHTALEAPTYTSVLASGLRERIAGAAIHAIPALPPGGAAQ